MTWQQQVALQLHATSCFPRLQTWPLTPTCVLWFLCDSAGLGRAVKLQLTSEQQQQYGPSFEELTADITPETASRLHVKIQPTGQARWEVPNSIVPR